MGTGKVTPEVVKYEWCWDTGGKGGARSRIVTRLPGRPLSESICAETSYANLVPGSWDDQCDQMKRGYLSCLYRWCQGFGCALCSSLSSPLQLQVLGHAGEAECPLQYDSLLELLGRKVAKSETWSPWHETNNCSLCVTNTQPRHPVRAAADLSVEESSSLSATHISCDQNKPVLATSESLNWVQFPVVGCHLVFIQGQFELWRRETDRYQFVNKITQQTEITN